MPRDATIVRGPCYCGSADFERVRVLQKNGEFYVTEFVSSRVCGVMYHRPDWTKQIEAMSPEREAFLTLTGWLK